MNLAKSFDTAIQKKVEVHMKQKADTIRAKIVAEAKEWRLDVAGWLRKTGRPDGNKFPMEITGQIRRAVHYRNDKRVQHTRGSKTWKFSIHVWFSKVTSYNTWVTKDGRRHFSPRKHPTDYSNAVNEGGGKRGTGYKQRIVEDLHKRVDKIRRMR